MVGIIEISIPLGNNVNVEEEIKKMEDEIKYLQGFLISVEKKLGNEKFVANAKPEVVENERKKKADAESAERAPSNSAIIQSPFYGKRVLVQIIYCGRLPKRGANNKLIGGVKTDANAVLIGYYCVHPNHEGL